MEKVADMLDIVIINLRDAGNIEELSNETLYTKLQKKSPEEKINQYYWWIYKKENKKVLRLQENGLYIKWRTGNINNKDHTWFKISR